MTDDIVTRLREAVSYDDGYAVTVERPTLSYIADEIERLRDERDYWKQKADMLADLIRALSRNTSFLEYEREREQRINGTNND